VNVPCARAPQEGPPLYDGTATLGAGDLFTCVADRTGIRCWGANRDGFFGVPGSCPESLRTAWPTLHGPVSAPRAACAPKPVRIPDVRYFEPGFQVAPRALCFSGPGSPWRCIGGLPKPRGAAVKWATPSPGADASACAIGPKGVLCWGEAYSPPHAPGMLVPIALDRSAPPLAEMAVLDPPGLEKWDQRCLVHRGCSALPVVVPPCGPTMHARDWSDVLSSGEARLGEIVQVRGRLGVSPLAPRPRVLPKDSSAAIGGRTCDGRVEGSVVLDGSPHVPSLEGFTCSGDESRQCCNAPAYGQAVVATGRLELQLGTGRDPQWTLAAVRLCSESPP